MSSFPDLLGGPPPTLLPSHAGADADRAGGANAVAVTARHPEDSAGWADLADEALAGAGDAAALQGYAYARVGYHRGLDQLRRNGWKGHGPVPWAHPGNQGWLRCVGALSKAAGRIGETPEQQRCAQLLEDSDPAAVTALA